MAMRRWQNITSYSNSEVPNFEAYIPRKHRSYVCSSSEKNLAKKIWLVVYILSSCPTPVCEGRRRSFSRKNSLFLFLPLCPRHQDRSHDLFWRREIHQDSLQFDIRMPKAHKTKKNKWQCLNPEGADRWIHSPPFWSKQGAAGAADKYGKNPKPGGIIPDKKRAQKRATSAAFATHFSRPLFVQVFSRLSENTA